MKTGDKVQVLGALGANGRPIQCTLTAWHPDPRPTRQGRGEWSFVRADGREGTADPRDVYPWTAE